MTPPRLSLVIPAYNEAGRIGGTVATSVRISIGSRTRGN